MTIIPFHYDFNNNAVALFDQNHREGGYLNEGEGAFGFPIEAFKRAVYGKLMPVAGTKDWRLISLVDLKLV